MDDREVHAVVGAAGATGRLVVRELVAAGRTVRALTRDGRDLGVPGAQRLAVDAGDPRALAQACAGASVVHQCAMPPLRQWRAEFPALTDAVITAAEAAGARVVHADDTWMYGRVDGPMTDDLPYRPVSDLGVLRAWVTERLEHAATAGRIRLSVVRAGELFGPGARSMIAGPVFGALQRGRRPRWLGSADVPITPTYVGDFARTIAVVGRRDDARSAVWHVPHPAALTGRQFVELATTITAEHRGPLRRRPVAPVGRPALRALGLLSPLARDAAALLYQFERPFIVDGSRTTAAFGIEPTPYVDSIRATVTGQPVPTPGPLRVAS